MVAVVLVLGLAAGLAWLVFYEEQMADKEQDTQELVARLS